jgi:hypothetical protein
MGAGLDVLSGDVEAGARVMDVPLLADAGSGNGRGVAPVVAHEHDAEATTMSRARMGFARIIG